MPRFEPGQSIWRGICLLIAPLATLFALVSLVFETGIEALVEVRGLVIVSAVASSAASMLVIRRPHVGPLALLAAIFVFALVIYVAATMSGAASAVSLLDRPTALISIVGASVTLAALLPGPSGPDPDDV